MSIPAEDQLPVRQFFRARYRWLFRFIAVLLSISVFALLELICSIAGWGSPDVTDDPFVGFSSIRPLFEPAADGVNYHTSPARRGFFREDSFALRKPAGEFRVFVFGGSTVQGSPFSIETSFPAYLQIALQNAAPGHFWKVVNCGGVSYASYRLLPVMLECSSYEPDLFIFCEGHNEFLENVSYAETQRPAIVSQVYSAFSRFRWFRLLRHAILSLSGNSPQQAAAKAGSSKPILATEVDTLLDHEGGLEAYHRNDDHSAVVAKHFRSNLQRVAGLCKSRRIPLLMILPPSNLSDCPPFKSEFSDELSAAIRTRIQEQLRESRTVARTDLSQAIDRLIEVTALDPRFAFSWYELGQLQLSAGRIEEAEASLRRARDEDICPLRMTTTLESVMRDVIRQNAVSFIDAHHLLRSRCTNGIVGGNVLVDHVHPSFRSHEDIAIAIAEWMILENLVQNRSDAWRAATRAECKMRLQSLDDLYFLRGQRALESLRLWAAGRSGGLPL